MNKQSFAVTVGGAALAAILPLASAATLTTVPMQGSMVMPMIAYDAVEGRLSVMLPPDVPQLTSLLASNPADSFDPADPWFNALDPSRQGLSFSRRYGFVMATQTDPLPAGTGIWIRKLSGSPELGFYRCHMMSLPKKWEPIFGTAGSANTFSWSGSMFHPCVTAQPGSNAFSATFEAYLADTTTGAEVPGSKSGPFILDFTNVPDGRPALSLAPRLVVFWPADTTNYLLEATDDVAAGNWSPVTNSPVMVDGQTAVLLPAGEPRQFFRMKRTP